ncbi:MAG TPA: response regulator, partial [Steroidobacteraceae bacterium]|nr:response regulator [Steroidobacteraceae bacterium]
MTDTVAAHVLVVDDDPQIRQLLQEYLQTNGLRVSAVAHSIAMTELLSKETIDLIVLDLRLAGEDGMTVARKLR